MGAGEADFAVVLEPLPVPTRFTGFSFVARATKKDQIRSLKYTRTIIHIPVELLFDDSFAVVRLVA